jgi:hypothetical protein
MKLLPRQQNLLKENMQSIKNAVGDNDPSELHYETAAKILDLLEPFLEETLTVVLNDAKSNKDRYAYGVNFLTFEGEYFEGSLVMEQRKTPKQKQTWHRPIIVLPKKIDVFAALARDAATIADYGSFSEWCDNLGYDNDSFKAFDMYRICEKTYSALRQVFRHDDFTLLTSLVHAL